jgi:D-alanyl-D-alanine carboxypeptidase
MRSLIKIFIITVLFFSIHAEAQNKTNDVNTNIEQIFRNHYKQYKDQEYFSGASLSIYIPEQTIKNYYIGNMSHEKNSEKISSKTLFQIGSITKSFTAAIILQLEKENKLSLDDPLKKWLPTYSKWSDISIKQLLNMTSGLPNYSDMPLWAAEEYQNPSRAWKEEDLIHFAYPSGKFSPPLKKGYAYTNTSYILAGLVIEKASDNHFTDELVRRTIKQAHLENTFYTGPLLDKKVQDRLAYAYNYNQYENPELVGKDVRDFNLSWAGAAGAVISNSEDIIKWVKALFVDDTLLDTTQKNKMMQIVSLSKGTAIKNTNKKDPYGFGLGVIQAFNNELGRYWFYEGQTLGFRATYMYMPCNGVIISSIFNSATNPENDHSGELMKAIYKSLLDQHSQLICKE